MPLTVFPFTVQRPYREWRALSTRGTRLNGGLLQREDEFDTPGWAYRAAFSVKLPRGGQTIDDFDDFVESHLGSGVFLFKAQRTRNRSATSEAVGTGNSSNKVFVLDKKYVDGSTLQVYVNGVLQTLTTHYTFTLNETTPTITFVTAPPATQAVTATYEFYMPCWFVDDEMVPDLERGGSASATLPHKLDRFRIGEQFAGAHLVG